MTELQHPELSLGANLVLDHRSYLKRNNQLNRSNLIEKVQNDERLDEEKIEDILQELSLENIT